MELSKNLEKLKDEIADDPLGRGYAGMADQAVADDLNTAYRTREVGSFSGDFMFSRTDPTEFGGLTEHKQVLWLSFCSRQSVDPWAANNEEFVKWVFGETAQTVANLGNDRTENITRARELGYNEITPEWVARCREVI